MRAEGSRLAVFIIVVAMAIAVIGTLRAVDVQRSYALWNEISEVMAENELLEKEWSKLKLEESMLVTAALLDQETREHLGMVVPDENAVVYIIEAGTQGEYADITTQQAPLILD